MDDNNRGTALAFATMGSGVGIASWSLLLPEIVVRSSWNYGWISMGVFGFIVAGVNFLLIRNPPAQNVSSGSDPMQISYLQQKLKEMMSKIWTRAIRSQTR